MQRERKFFILFGVNPVLEKLGAAPGDVVEILIAAGKKGPSLRGLEAAARRHGVTVRLVDVTHLNRLAEGGKHQGVVARVEPYPYGNFASLVGQLPTSPGHHWVLFLDGLNDPRNFGAVLRAAEGVGIVDVVIPKDRAVGVTSTVVKTSAGAVQHMRIYRVPNLRQAIMALKEKEYWAVGLDAAAGDKIYGKRYPEKLLVVLGAEGSGIRPLIRRECDFLVSLPMRGKVESLNVAVAAGVFFYELLRQKEEGPGSAVGGPMPAGN